MSPNISASKSPLRDCVRSSSRDGQFSFQPDITKVKNGKLRCRISKQQQPMNDETIIALKLPRYLEAACGLTLPGNPRPSDGMRPSAVGSSRKKWVC
jgi:hypothetical protein